jgi:hypothetical protein
MKAYLLVSAISFSLLNLSYSFASSDESEPAETMRKISNKKIVQFSPRTFLRKAEPQLDNRYQNVKGQITTCLRELNWKQENESRLCWQTLKALKDQILLSKKLDDLPYCYMTMAKLFLSTQSLPSFTLSSQVQTGTPTELNSYLRTRMAEFNLNDDQANTGGKIYKWSLLYQAMLNMDYVHRNPNSERAQSLLIDSLRCLQKAEELKTTKSAFLLRAKLYLEFGQALNLGDVHNLVTKQLELAGKVKSTNAKSNPANKAHRGHSFWNTVARPPYYTDAIVQQDVEALTRQIADNQRAASQAAVDDSMDEDVAAMHAAPNVEPMVVELPHIVSLTPEQAIGLPARTIDPQYRLEKIPEAPHIINGIHFASWHVSGHDFRCFFNSMGLNAADQITLLLNNQNDPVIRAIIANEIVSAWHHYYELQAPVRQALQSADLANRQGRLNRLMGSNRQEELRAQITQEQNAILNELRVRASRPEVFVSFVTHQIGTRIDSEEGSPYPMMVMQADVQGDEEKTDNNALYNLSAIDAILRLNNIGGRFFHIKRSNRRLIHEYIPEGATQIAYLRYSHAAQHFDALVPYDEIDEEIQEGSDYTQLDDTIQAAYERAQQKEQINSELQKLLKQRFPKVVNTTENTDDYIRLVLFLKARKMGTTTIVKQPLIPWKRSAIARILLDNEATDGRKTKYDDQTSDAIFDAFLSSGYTVTKDDMTALTPVCNAIGAHLNTDSIQVYKYLYFHFISRRSQAAQSTMTFEKREEIVALYKSGQKFSQISAQLDVARCHIFDVLHEGLSEADRPKVLNRQQIKLKGNDDERDQQIVKMFHALKTQQKGKDPTATKVAEECGVSLKVALKVLKAAGLVKATKRSAHMSAEKIKKIKDYWHHKEWETASNKEEHYEATAQKFNVSKTQVIDILKDRTYKAPKRVHKITSASIKAAYDDLSANQLEDPVLHLESVLKVSKAQIVNALKLYNIQVPTQTNIPKNKRAHVQQVPNNTNSSTNKRARVQEDVLF